MNHKISTKYMFIRYTDLFLDLVWLGEGTPGVAVLTKGRRTILLLGVLTSSNRHCIDGKMNMITPKGERDRETGCT